MSFDDDFAADELLDLYEDFGVDAIVTRGAELPVPVRIIVDRDQERLGEFGQVVARVDKLRCMSLHWQWRQGDQVAWTDRFGHHTRTVESQADADGLESWGVLLSG